LPVAVLLPGVSVDPEERGEGGAVRPDPPERVNDCRDPTAQSGGDPPPRDGVLRGEGGEAVGT
jgi:hypothetical protein